MNKSYKQKRTNVKIVYSKCLDIEQQRQHLYHSKTKINITGLNVCFVISLDNRKRISSLNGYVWLENSDCAIRISLIELFFVYVILLYMCDLKWFIFVAYCLWKPINKYKKALNSFCVSYCFFGSGEFRRSFCVQWILFKHTLNIRIS